MALPDIRGRVPAATLLTYALPGLPLAALQLPLFVYLPAFYAQELGLGLAAGIALALLYAGLPIFLKLAAMSLLRGFPITEASHTQLRARLASTA